MKISKVWEIFKKFKLLCQRQGWKTSDSEDWVETGDNYHNFLWAREVHPSSFRKIALNQKCIVKDGLSYHVVDAAYTAWLFSDTPPEEVVKTVSANPDLARRIALYDMSQVMERKKLCIRLNRTDSHVFREFENFLQNDLKVRVESHPFLFGQKVNPGDCVTTVMA